VTFDIKKINLSRLSQLTGISRQRLRTLKKTNFTVAPHGNTGKVRSITVLSGYEGIVDNYLMLGVTNSEVIFENLQENGYKGGCTSVKNYIAKHRDLVPAQRQIVSTQGNRGRRYQTGPGEVYQMDWGFVNVETSDGGSYRAACFAMICHHCGQRYIEFFPNAKQENLFIGMIHAFTYMGVPETVLTDNMKSVVIERDAEGNPIWQNDYEEFMKTIGFNTKLCKVAHPFTKGAVERLVRFVKENFMAGRVFGNITDLNYEALRWCNAQNGKYHKAVDCIPAEKHQSECMMTAKILTVDHDVMMYLCPVRKISFDGFVNYEGRRFGVPYWYQKKTCRVKRDGYILYIYDADMTKILTTHDVTWSRQDSFCKEQYAVTQPEEHPTAPVRVHIQQLDPKDYDPGFSRFDFEGVAHYE
jgi:transposase